MKNNKIQKSSGFTIVELVISIFVLSIAVIGAYNAFSVVVVLTNNSADRLVGAYLAQEGIEIVRNIRDSNWISDRGWADGLSDDNTNCTKSSDNVGGCEAYYKTMGEPSPVLVPWPSGSPEHPGGNPLRIDADGFYSYSPSDAKTKFKRRIIITKLDDSIDVTVQVSWDEKATLLNGAGKAGDCGGSSDNSHCITAEEIIYNWY